MRRLLLVAVLIVAAAPAIAGDLTLSGTVAYDDRQYGANSRKGTEQTFTLGLQRYWEPMSVRLWLRAQNFDGFRDSASVSNEMRTTQVQPIADFLYAVGGFSAMVRHDYLGTRTEADDQTTRTTNERTSAALAWSRERFPMLSVSAQRNRVDQLSREVEDASAGATLGYTIAGLDVAASSQVTRSLDAMAAYERTSAMNGGRLGYQAGFFDNRLNVRVDGNANVTKYKEHATGSGAGDSAFPVFISRALYSVDETPEDGRDHPPANLPALIDGAVNTPAGISLGPDAPAFQNIILDLGRIDTVDEIRLVVRDDAGDPVKRVGTVSFDLYTSDDGQLWRPGTSASTWDALVSRYSVRFDSANSRWFKVVTFGANPEPVLVTEVQAVDHRRIDPGAERITDQSQYNGFVEVSGRPLQRLMLRYSGTYGGYEVTDSATEARRQTDLQHGLNAEVTILRSLVAGAQLTQHEIDASDRTTDSDDAYSVYVRANPSTRLELGADYTSRDTTRDLDAYSLDTIALHSRARLLRSLTITGDGGVDRAMNGDSGTRSTRQFLNLAADAQLYPTIRLLLGVSAQNTNAPSGEQAVYFGVRDTRGYADVAWTPSSYFHVRARYGWVRAAEVSELTQQYMLDWNPFRGGNVTISISHQEDFDPYRGRRTRRTTLRPRWIINELASFDINFFSFETVYGGTVSRQRSLYAALNLTRK